MNCDQTLSKSYFRMIFSDNTSTAIITLVCCVCVDDTHRIESTTTASQMIWQTFFRLIFSCLCRCRFTGDECVPLAFAPSTTMLAYVYVVYVWQVQASNQLLGLLLSSCFDEKSCPANRATEQNVKQNAKSTNRRDSNTMEHEIDSLNGLRYLDDCGDDVAIEVDEVLKLPKSNFGAAMERNRRQSSVSGGKTEQILRNISFSGWCIAMCQ